MAQLRQDYQQFVERNTEIVVIGPEDTGAFGDYWRKEDLPFVGCPDPDHVVADRYGQEVKLLKMGRMPALMVVDRQGTVAYSHYGNSMRDIPPNSEVLSLLDDLNRQWKAHSGMDDTGTSQASRNTGKAVEPASPVAEE